MSRKNLNIISVCLGILIVILFNFLGHNEMLDLFLPTVFGVPIIIGIINYPLFKVNFRIAVVYSYCLILLNNYILWAYTISDSSGQGGGYIFVACSAGFLLSTFTIYIDAFISSSTTGDISRSHVFLRKSIFVTVAAIIFAIIYCTWFFHR